MSFIARPTTSVARDVFAFVWGQSLGQEIADHASWPGIWYTLKSAGLGISNPEKKVSATGGSSILKKFARTDIPNLYWYDEDTGTDGPLLTQAIAVIATEIAASRTPNYIIGVQGEQDADQMTNSSDAALYRAGYEHVVSALRTAVGAGTNTEVVVSILGRRNIGGDYPGWALVRQKHLEIVAAGTNMAGAEKYHIDLRDTVHPTHNGHLNMGWDIGQKLSVLLGSVAGFKTGPIIDVGNITRAGNVVSIPITSESSRLITHPGSPCGFGFELGGVLLNPSWSWQGDTLKATFSSSPAGAVMKYPYNQIPDFAKSSVIKYTTTGGPAAISDGLDGLPLRSILPVSIA